MRKISCSQTTTEMMQKKGLDRFEIFGFFPVDKYDCECQPIIKETIRKLALLSEENRKNLRHQMGFISCPKPRAGRNKYKVSCVNCKEVIGYCYATDETLTDWNDFHYVGWTDGQYWYGCYTPHISPITMQLCFECCCGQDTRDFRANMRIDSDEAGRIEDNNSIGRQFNQEDSKYLVEKVVE